MSSQRFEIKLNARLVPQARELHAISKVGDPVGRRGGGGSQSFEKFLSDLVAVAILDRAAALSGMRCYRA